jgi:hypothetical protein
MDKLKKESGGSVARLEEFLDALTEILGESEHRYTKEEVEEARKRVEKFEREALAALLELARANNVELYYVKMDVGIPKESKAPREKTKNDQAQKA